MDSHDTIDTFPPLCTQVSPRGLGVHRLKVGFSPVFAMVSPVTAPLYSLVLGMGPCVPIVYFDQGYSIYVGPLDCGVTHALMVSPTDSELRFWLNNFEWCTEPGTFVAGVVFVSKHAAVVHTTLFYCIFNQLNRINIDLARAGTNL